MCIDSGKRNRIDLDGLIIRKSEISKQSCAMAESEDPNVTENTLFGRLKTQCVWSACPTEVRDNAISAVIKQPTGAVAEPGSGKSQFGALVGS